MKAPIRVLVVDDSSDITDMLGYIIGVEADLECVGCATAADGLPEEVRRVHPDVLILDASMPGKDPLIALQECAIEFPAVRTIVYSGYDDPSLIERVIDARAWGFVSKREDPDVVIRAIRAVATGQVVFPDRRRRAAETGAKGSRTPNDPPSADDRGA